MGLGRFFLFGVALVVALVALAWPQIEQLLSKDADNKAAAEAEMMPKYTLDQLRMYDGSNENSPILIAVGGKVLDVTSGAKFYGKGKSYNLFAGTACTRALALGSLKKEDISDDISDFDAKKLKELVETKSFYYEKYPIVGELA